MATDLSGRTAGQLVGPDLKIIATELIAAEASIADKADLTHGHVISDVTGLTEALDPATQPGYRFWNGTSWSARPTCLFAIAYSDGTGTSTRDAAAPVPPDDVDGDLWAAVPS